MQVPAAVIIPTRRRPRYLAVALASIAPQAAATGAEVLIVEDDGPDAGNAELARTHGARYVALGARHGLNAARNAGLRATTGELAVYVDDDVEVAPGWLAALLAAARAQPDVEAFTGPVHARFDGRQLRMCGREGPPITFLELGTEDRDVKRAWGVNLAVRRDAFARVGEFDERRSGGGDEEEWEERLLAAGGRIRYVAAAALDHRREGADTELRSLIRAAYRRGAEVRAYDAEDGSPPPLHHELRVLAGCLWHALRRRCENGLVLAAHSAGRISAWRTRPLPASADGDDFLSGESGTVGGRRDLLRAAADAALDALLLFARPRVRAIPRRVLVLSVVRPHNQATFTRAAAELHGASAHRLTFATCPPGEHGKFENLNLLLAGRDLRQYDWLLLLDDDVRLPHGFLNRFLGLAERFELRIAQPAHRLRSHAAWRLTRRRAWSLVRETAFVEIGPVTALHRETFERLLPFPQLRMGWGLDAHWAAVARQEGWRIGIVDATPIAHREQPVAGDYGREQALHEARAFLAGHPYLPASESQRTLAVHRR